MPLNLSEKHIANIKEMFENSIKTKQKIVENPILVAKIFEIAEAVANCIENGGKLMICGNGGSASDAQHIAAEFLVRLRSEFNRKPLPAISLCLDSSSITACGNDYGYDVYFSRMVEALSKKGDCLLGITTSGSSENINMAFAKAQELGVKTIGLLGKDGGKALPMCDIAFVVPFDITGRIQETHITIGHAIVETVENLLVERKFI